jgi:Flp pilus assembly protein TadG
MQKKQKGTSTIEFVMILPLLLIVMFGSIEFGIMMFNKALVTNTSREIARSLVALRSPPLTGSELGGLAETIKSAYCGQAISFSNADCEFALYYNPSGTNPAQVNTENATNSIILHSGVPFRVDVDFTYTPLVIGNLLDWATNKTLTMSSSSIMYTE